MNNFNIQPKKELFLKIFSSKSVFANIVAFDLLSQNNRIKTIDKTEIESLLKTENLNTKYWLLVYEIIYNAWTTSIPGTIITNHIFFEILKRDNINFYDNSRKLEPLKTEQSHFDKINKKLHQIDSFLASNQIVNTEINSELLELSDELEGSSVANRNDIRLRLTKSDQLIKSLILKIEKVKNEISEFEERRPYFVLGKRLEELDLLTSKEIVTESKQDKELLFDPKYK